MAEGSEGDPEGRQRRKEHVELLPEGKDIVDAMMNDPLPAEASQMESVFSADHTADGAAPDAGAAASEAAAAIAAVADADTTAGATAGFSEMNMDAEGLNDAHALAAARAQIAAVAEELATLQEQFGAVQSKGDAIAAVELDRYNINKVSNTDGDLSAQQQERIIRLERAVRHLQVDFDGAKARAERLTYEKEELLGAQAQLEADLRRSRQSLEDMGRRLRHREMDLQQLTGKPPELVVEAEDESFRNEPSANQNAAAALVSPALRAVAESARPLNNLSKSQAIAALKATQAELKDERKRRERLERRIQKDRERLERLMSVAERQRDEIRSLQKGYSSEAMVQDSVYNSLAQTSPLHAGPHHALLDGEVSPGESPIAVASRPSGTPPFGNRVGHSGATSPSAITRQQSCPTRLPSVAPPKR
mmetsp:Transcript_89310/g.168266  ORF Transcript_89310/g.168266 Transcript_89310/m.168266 type:complete len:421 (+) Transcript_89310:94-1356(+)